MTFRIGMKVECVKRKSEYDPLFGDPAWPKEIVPGCVYTVRDVDTRAVDFGWPIVLRFEEYHEAPRHCPETGGAWECGFPGDCFRPVTDISVFTAMLDRERCELPVRVIAAHDQHAHVSPEPNETIQASYSL